jgi:Flp pilus assembly protein TadD
MRGKLDEAVTAFRTAIRLEPNSALAHYGLGIALKEQGKPDEAIAAFREARTHARPGSEVAQLVEGALTESGR